MFAKAGDASTDARSGCLRFLRAAAGEDTDDERGADYSEQRAKRIGSRGWRALRPGKIFIDWSQNDPHKTTVSVYSLRARSTPTVSTPVTWPEVQKCVRTRDPQTLVFDSAAVLQRVKRRGNLFAPLLSLRQKLPKI